MQKSIVDKVVGHLDRQSKASQYVDDPVLWAKEYLGVTLWSKQREIAYSVRDNKSTAVKASHSVGKSFLAAILIAWWIDVHPIGEAFFFTTAPSSNQVSVVLGRELRKLLSLSKKRFEDGLIDHPLPGHFVSPNEWKLDNGTVLGMGRKPPDHTTDDAVQGIHERYVLAVGDEANGLTREMIDALGNITTNDFSRRLIIGNPTNPASHFGHIYKQELENWVRFTINAFDSPNFTDEKHEMPKDALEKLVGPSWVEERRIEWGGNDPRWKSRVLGECGYDRGDTFITDTEVVHGMDTEIVLSEGSRPVLGVDVSRYGEDKSTIYSCRDGQLRYVDSWSKASTIESANRVHRAALETGAVEVRVDGIGLGGGVIDQILTLCGDLYTVVDMNSSHASPDPKQWHNARAFWWSNFKDKLFQGQIDLDPQDDNLLDELIVPRYEYANTGGLLIESKKDMKKRGVGSPDYADAAIYAATDLWIDDSDQYVKTGTVVSAPIVDDFGWDTVLAW